LSNKGKLSFMWSTRHRDNLVINYLCLSMPLFWQRYELLVLWSPLQEVTSISGLTSLIILLHYISAQLKSGHIQITSYWVFIQTVDTTGSLPTGFKQTVDTTGSIPTGFKQTVDTTESLPTGFIQTITLSYLL
jgi:hypothetical protein